MDAHRDAVLEVTAWQLAACTLVMGAWAAAAAALGGGGAPHAADAAARGGRVRAAARARRGRLLVWMGMMTTALVLWGQTAFMRTVPGHECALIFATEPVWAAGFAHLTLGESLGGAQLAGAALIVGACVVNELRLPTAPPPPLARSRPAERTSSSRRRLRRRCRRLARESCAWTAATRSEAPARARAVGAPCRIAPRALHARTPWPKSSGSGRPRGPDWRAKRAQLAARRCSPI